MLFCFQGSDLSLEKNENRMYQCSRRFSNENMLMKLWTLHSEISGGKYHWAFTSSEWFVVVYLPNGNGYHCVRVVFLWDAANFSSDITYLRKQRVPFIPVQTQRNTVGDYT